MPHGAEIQALENALRCRATVRIINPPLAIARLRLHASELSICLSVCLSVAKMQKNAIFSKTKQFRATVSINDL